ncbi:imelysin, partial [Aliarcobacter butzleri]
LLSASAVASPALTSHAAANSSEVKKVEVAKQASILEAYANIALDNYTNALKEAKNLKVAIDKFAKAPTQENFDAA